MRGRRRGRQGNRRALLRYNERRENMSTGKRIDRRALLGTATAAAIGATLRPDGANADSGPATAETVPVVFGSNPPDGWEVAIDKDGDAGVTSFAAISAKFNPPATRLRVSRPVEPPVPGEPQVGRHLQLVPYKYGAAIEYDGVLECWVRDFSVHKSGNPTDPSGGARFWVGNHDDTGGLRITAFNYRDVRYSEISSQLFTGATGGDMRFVVRDSADSFDFRSGSGGDEQTHLRITSSGQVMAGFGTRHQVQVGEAGPQGQAGVKFGPKDDASIYRQSKSRVRTDARFVAAGGLAVGGAERTRRIGRVVSRLQIFDTDGKSLGFLPIHAKK